MSGWCLEDNKTGERCTQWHEGQGLRGCCTLLKYRVNSEGYIREWVCPKCGYCYRPIDRFRKNIAPLKLNDKECGSGECGVCEL